MSYTPRADVQESAYNEQLSFTGTGTPTGGSHRYSVQVFGKTVLLNLWINFSSAGGGSITSFSCPFTSDMPLPVEPTGFNTTNDYMWDGVGGLSTATNAPSGNQGHSYIQKTGTNTYAVVISSAGGNYTKARATIIYTRQ